MHVQDFQSAKLTMIDCILSKWSSSHRLKLNAAKSEVIWLGTRQQLSKLSTTDKKTLCLPDSTLAPSSVVKNLGVYIDEQISMQLNAWQCAKTCYFHIHRIRQLSRLVDRDTLHTLVHSLVLGRLDYCNCTSSTLHRLQRWLKQLNGLFQ